MRSMFEWFIQKTGKKPDPEPEKEEEVNTPSITLGQPSFRLASLDIDAEMIKRERMLSQYRDMLIHEERMRSLQTYQPRDYGHLNSVPSGQGIREQISSTERSVIQSANTDGYREHMLYTGGLGYRSMIDLARDYHRQYEMYNARFQDELGKVNWWEKKKIVLNANTRTI